MSTENPALRETRAWVERAVIGLNLCPFAHVPQRAGRVRYVLSEAETPKALMEVLVQELELLAETPPGKIETTLLVHPFALQDFHDYNDFLEVVDEVLAELDLEGILQVASFHPDYQFDGTAVDDITNATNRSPYPTLHLLREESIERATDAVPEPDAIFEANRATLLALGADAWAALQAQCREDAGKG